MLRCAYSGMERALSEPCLGRTTHQLVYRISGREERNTPEHNLNMTGKATGKESRKGLSKRVASNVIELRCDVMRGIIPALAGLTAAIAHE